MNELPPVDRFEASRAAIVARRARAAVKSALSSGERTALDVFTVATIDRDSAEARLRVTEFLGSLPGLGRIKIDAVLEEIGISQRKRLGGLGVRQRHLLRETLLSRARRRGEHHIPRVVVVAGPTAVGKGTVVARILQQFPEVHMSVSATTRSPRPGEVDGVDYYFVSEKKFDELIASDELLEWARVHGTHRYGTPRGPIQDALNRGQSVLLEIDLQGARQVKQHMPQARTVLLEPPSWEELSRRLVGRGTESLEEQSRRLDTARDEIAARMEFDVRVVNDDVATTVKHIVDLMGLTEEQ